MMTRLLILIALLLATAELQAQEGALVDVYICETGSGCSHSVTSQEFDRNAWEVTLGYPPAGANASVVCLGSGACGWTNEAIEDIDAREGGDGIVEPIETIPADYLPTPENATPPDEPADPSTLIDDPNLDSRDFWVLICREGQCRTARSKITLNDAIILIGEEPPAGDFYIRCDETGCQWELWGGTIQPIDGMWRIDQRNPTAFNCPQDANNTLENLTAQFSGEKTWTNPPQPADIFDSPLTEWDRVVPSIPYTNGYTLRLVQESDMLNASVVYEWAVISESFISGTVVIDLPSILGGRCVVYVPFEMTHEG